MPHNRGKVGGNVHMDVQNAMENTNANMSICCVPTGCQQGDPTIDRADMSNVTKVVCNNESCKQGDCMHSECFDEWEQTVLTYLKSTGRARSWSEKQRLQNLWTKKGYDLAYKACSCKCGKGHLRKDLNWVAPPPQNDAPLKKKKNRRKKNDKPTLNMPTPQNREVRMRTSSLSSTCSSSPPSSGGGELAVGSPGSPVRFSDIISRERRDSGGSLGSGLGNGYVHAPNKFTRRQDFSSFSTLPRHRMNSYHIKMEDEVGSGNDEIRNLVLTSLGAAKTAKVSCVLCHNSMNIFDRYPLIDGTFFLSPRQHSKGCVPLKLDQNGGGRSQQYLNAVCMPCLEGWGTTVRCRYCQTQWSGKSLILGTMYSYDIFAATPCCAERLKCNNCHRMILMPDQRLQYFSNYSRSVPCPSCAVIDFHFIKSLSTYNRRNESLHTA